METPPSQKSISQIKTDLVKMLVAKQINRERFLLEFLRQLIYVNSLCYDKYLETGDDKLHAGYLIHLHKETAYMDWLSGLRAVLKQNENRHAMKIIEAVDAFMFKWIKDILVSYSLNLEN